MFFFPFFFSSFSRFFLPSVFFSCLTSSSYYCLFKPFINTICIIVGMIMIIIAIFIFFSAFLNIRLFNIAVNTFWYSDGKSVELWKLFCLLFFPIAYAPKVTKLLFIFFQLCLCLCLSDVGKVKHVFMFRLLWITKAFNFTNFVQNSFNFDHKIGINWCSTFFLCVHW